MASIGVLGLLVFSASLLAILAFVVPLTGTLVRFRANYNPKGLQLDQEGGAQPHTGPVVSTYFGMLKRVYKIEGWAGLYKGLTPTLLTSAVIAGFLLFFFNASGGHEVYKAPQTGIIGIFLYSLFYSIISLPAVIVTYRSIITPYRLPWFNPITSLRIILTPTERRRPWTLYLTPGLLAAQVTHIAYAILILQVLRRLLLPSFFEPGDEIPSNLPIWRLVLWLAISMASTVVLTPLEVVTTRLAIQRNHAAAEYNSVSQEVEGEEELAELYGDSEDVIGLRHERDPYLGFGDCVKRIIDEEGVRTLYRGWWITMLGGLAK